MRGVILLLALIGTTYGVPNHGSRIVGGESTSIEAYPFMASMQHGYLATVFRHVCGATLITGTALLSAAQCYTRNIPDEWRVRVGSTSATNGGTQHTIARIILHENYNERLMLNDIAIVRLHNAVSASTSVGSARIIGPNYPLFSGTNVFAAGWGRLRPGGLSSDVLQHVSTFLIDHNTCASRYADLKTQPGFQNWPDVTPEMLCDGNLGIGGGSCQYDVGGPLIYQRDIVVGIISWGFGCGDSFYPGVNVRVALYTDWILRNSVA